MTNNNPAWSQDSPRVDRPDELSRARIERPDSHSLETLNSTLLSLVSLFSVLRSGDISVSPSEKRRQQILRQREEEELGILQPVGAYRSTPVGLEALRSSDQELYQKVVTLLSSLGGSSGNPRSVSNSELSREWFRFAAEDLGDALLLGDQGDRASRNALYFTQQSIEKSLKGLIILTSAAPIEARELRKHGHNLDALLKSVADSVDPKLVRVAEEISVVNPQSTRYRYPGEIAPSSPSEHEVQTVFQAAKVAFREIVDLALEQLNEKS